MLSSILQNAGYKTGLYISPHLEYITERIKINSHDIDEDLLCDYVNKIDAAANLNKITPTYFDILTTAAFNYFSAQSVDIAIIETGLGGRLDSTNVITPELSIITDISLDHVQILGNRIEDIAKEKCGIIKPGITVVTSNTDTAILGIISEYSLINNAECYAFERDFYAENITRKDDNFKFDYNDSETLLKEVEISLFPEHQVKNASVVIASALHLKKNNFPLISEEIIYTTLKKAEVPGRFQKLSSKPLIIYDPAHNFQSLESLFRGLNTYYSDKKKKFIITLMKDKAETETIEIFNSSDVYYYPINDERAYIPEPNRFKNIISNDDEIIEIFKEGYKNNEMIIFTGTFRIFSHALRMTELFKEEHDEFFRDKQ